jgi:hypothetical protein
MIGGNTNIGIGFIGSYRRTGLVNGGAGGANIRYPEIFTPPQDATSVQLSAPAVSVLVIHNGIMLNQTTPQVPDGVFTHNANTTEINFNFNLDEGDVVIVIPYDGGNVRFPEIFTPVEDVVLIELSAPASKILVLHNGIMLNQTTPQVPEGSFTHNANTNQINFNFNINSGDVVTVIPYN